MTGFIQLWQDNSFRNLYDKPSLLWQSLTNSSNNTWCYLNWHKMDNETHTKRWQHNTWWRIRHYHGTNMGNYKWNFIPNIWPKKNACMYEVNSITISYQLIIKTNNSNTKYKKLISRIIINNVLYILEDLPEIMPVVRTKEP